MGSRYQKDQTVKYDIVIPYRENDSLELQYTVRGILKNFPHNKIHIIGDGMTGTDHKKHDWIDRHSVFMTVESKIVQACEEMVETDHFWLFNDDFFVLEETNGAGVCHRGTLQESITKRRFRDSYTLAMRNTMEYLKMQGISEPLDYETHMPMLFNTQKRLSYLNLLLPIWKRRDILMRSIYGNLEGIGGERVDDVKNLDNFLGKTFLSTSDTSFQNEPIGEYIMEKLA